ncbi:hypothetical protein Droror1_Dr00020037 [Drosera rotundifolia]
MQQNLQHQSCRCRCSVATAVNDTAGDARSRRASVLGREFFNSILSCRLMQNLSLDSQTQRKTNVDLSEPTKKTLTFAWFNFFFSGFVAVFILCPQFEKLLLSKIRGTLSQVQKAQQLVQVQNEVGLQFSSGMQTVGVIPIPSHAVVQLGSSLPIPEDLSFVQEYDSPPNQCPWCAFVRQLHHHKKFERFGANNTLCKIRSFVFL